MQLDVTAASGTLPTLDVVVQDTVDGTNWNTIATFTQATLNQVAGFDAQVLAQNLIYNQKDFWNFEWSTITSYTSGWQTGTTPVDLTGATIDATIVRRAIVDFQDSRTGIDFKIYDYPLVPLITTITLTDSASDAFTCASTAACLSQRWVRHFIVVSRHLIKHL